MSFRSSRIVSLLGTIGVVSLFVAVAEDERGMFLVCSAPIPVCSTLVSGHRGAGWHPGGPVNPREPKFGLPIGAFACLGLKQPHITQFVVYRGSAHALPSTALPFGSIAVFSTASPRSDIS
jgi:hypothetical protein